MADRKKRLQEPGKFLYTDSGKRAIELLSGASQTRDRWEVVHMTTYEAISLMISFGMLLIALLAYIDRIKQAKINKPLTVLADLSGLL